MLHTRYLSATGFALIAAATCWGQGESVATVFKRVSTSVVDVVTVQAELADHGQVGWVRSAGLGSGFVILAPGKIWPIQRSPVPTIGNRVLFIIVKSRPTRTGDIIVHTTRKENR